MLLEAIFHTLRPEEQIYVWRKEPHERRLFDTVDDVFTYTGKNPESDLYFGVSPRVRGEFDKVSRTCVSWADVDLKDFNGDPDKAARAIATFPVNPSFVIGSGHGYHVYWLLEEEVTGEQAQDICRGIMRIVGSDPTHNAIQIMRIPGTTNWKDPDKPVPVTVAVANPTVRYAADDLLKLTNLGEITISVIATGSTKGFPSRSERDWHVIRELTAADVSEKTIYAIADQKPVGDRWRGNDYRLLKHDLGRSQSSYGDAAEKFTEVQDALFYRGAKGLSQVSTFVIRPRKLLHDAEGVREDHIVCTVLAAGKVWEGVLFPRSAFSSQSSLHRHLPSIYWQWLGNDYQTKQLLVYLLGQLEELGVPEAKLTKVIGRHGNVWVAKDIVMSEKEIFDPEEAAYLYQSRSWSGNHSKAIDIAPNTRYTFPEDEGYSALCLSMSRLLPRINVPENVIPIIGWFCASPLKQLFNDNQIRFPHLNIFGTMGSGKTAVLQDVFMPLMGVERPTTQTSTTTNFVLRAIMAATNGIPVIFGEFRESSVSDRSDFQSLLRRAYNSGMDSRGRTDLKTETMLLLAPVVIDGEDSFSDPALKQRCVVVNLHPEDIRPGTEHNDAFKKLRELPLQEFAGKYIQRTLRETGSTLLERYATATKEMDSLLPSAVPDRVRNSCAIVRVGLSLYNEHMLAWGAEEISWGKDMVAANLGNVLLQLSRGVSRTYVDDFAEAIIGELAKEVIRRATPFVYMYDGESNVVWIHLTTAVHWWERAQRYRGKSSVEMVALRAQLRERCDPDEGYAIAETPIKSPSGEVTRCFGLKLSACVDAGLNVPDRLNSKVQKAMDRLI
jgi:hypothetical protein